LAKVLEATDNNALQPYLPRQLELVHPLLRLKKFLRTHIANAVPHDDLEGSLRRSWAVVASWRGFGSILRGFGRPGSLWEPN
jgi:hypothetical protein